MAGTIIILITIFLEYTVGWIDPKRNPDKTIIFIYENWSAMKWIWGVQLTGHIVSTAAFVLFIRSSQNLKRLIWSTLMLSSLMMVISFGIILWSYYPALEVYSADPEEFEKIRAISSPLYTIGRLGLLLYLPLFLLETLTKNGKVSRRIGISLLLLIIVFITIGLTTSVPVKLVGASWFFMPLLIGYYYQRYEADHSGEQTN